MSPSRDDLSRRAAQSRCLRSVIVHFSDGTGRDCFMWRMKSPVMALVGLGLSATSANAAVASTNFASQFPARVLAAHNASRVQAGVQPLAWDQALGEAAASYAMQLALTNSF